MRRTPSVLRFGGFAFAVAFSAAAPSFAQSNASFPDPSAPAPAPAAPQPAPAQPAPAAQPAPVPAAQPAPVPAAQPAPAPTPNALPPPPTYAAPGYAAPAAPGAAPAYSEPPPPPPRPPERPKEGFELPPIGVRLDPFKLLFDGKLAFELEVGLLDFLSVELVPIFIVNEEPPTFDYFVGRDDPLARESDGLGPLAGTSVGLGFWLSKKPLEGSVIRAIFTNYAYHYTASDERGEIDNVSHVERHLYAYYGSHSTWGAFTLAGGFGLGADLNHEERCFKNDPPDYPATRQGCDSDLLIKLGRTPVNGLLPVTDLNGGYGGVMFLIRFSVGVAIK